MMLIEPGHPNIENPAIFAIMAPQAILLPEFLPTIKGLLVGLLAAPQVFGMNRLGPSILRSARLPVWVWPALTR